MAWIMYADENDGNLVKGNAGETGWVRYIGNLPNEELLGILTVVDMIRSLLGAYEPARKTGLIPSQNRTT